MVDFKLDSTVTLCNEVALNRTASLDLSTMSPLHCLYCSRVLCSFKKLLVTLLDLYTHVACSVLSSGHCPSTGHFCIDALFVAFGSF